MAKVDGNDTIAVEFTYNHAGLRTKKTRKVNNAITEETEYILNGKNVVELIHTVYTTVGGETTTTTDVLHFYYDAQGRAAMVKHNGVMYGYVHDLQGDVIGILDSTGNVAVEYKYDAWGRPLSVTGTLAATLGELNPFRYRGYVFDEETQLYYLRSRYYQPFLVRWSISDILVGTGNKPLKTNVYAYCSNNPVSNYDPDGLYNREKTREYASEHYYYKSSYYFNYQKDCANFVSQCVYNGGIEMSDSWHSYRGEKWYSIIVSAIYNNLGYEWNVTEAWYGVKEQFDYFSDPENGYIDGEVLELYDSSDIMIYANSGIVQTGDLLYFCEDYCKPSHATIITKVEDGMIYYAGHTNPRFDYPLGNVIRYNPMVYIIRIKDDA